LSRGDGASAYEDLNQVTWEQRVMEGDPKLDASQTIPNVPYHRFADDWPQGYLTWTADNLLGHTFYVGLREDKPADQVRREAARETF
jgi:pyruvate dehydrogenase (quinone)